MTERTHDDAARVEIGSIGKGRLERERVSLSLSRWRGRWAFDVRIYVRLADGGTRATKKGTNIAVSDLPTFRAIVEEAEREARARGLLNDEGGAS